MLETIKKEQINVLIDVLVKSGGGRSQYGKLNAIIKLYTTENSLIRNTLLIWLDAMGVMEVDSLNNYQLNKPTWVKSSIENHFILYGAVTKDEIQKLEENSEIKKHDKNIISYKNFDIELPDTYYTTEHNVFKEFDYEIIDNPIFSEIDNLEDLSLIENKLYKGNVEKISYSLEGSSSEIDGFKIILDKEETPLYIKPQDDIKLFNWRTRSYIKCDIINELDIADEEEGLKLIKVIDRKDEYHKEYYTILLNKRSDKYWEYIYFDSKIIDERWARYLFIDKLEYYDIEKDFKRRDDSIKGLVGQNAMNAMSSYPELITRPPISSNFMKIPSIMRKQMVQYDSRQGLMAFSVRMPLPKEIMRYLFSCSGVVPQVFTNKFTLNPNYIIKSLFSGALSSEGENIPYPNQKYFMEEDFYLFSSVPTELAEKIFEKLNLDMNDDVFKRTFLQKV